MADEPTPTPSPENVYALLARKTESELRRILRSHRDFPFRGEEKYEQEDVQLRAALDIALDRLMVIEVRLETGSDSVSAPVNVDLLQLLQSSAFARYINSYLYFGVRFMAARLLGPDSYTPGPQRQTQVDAKDPATSEAHQKLSFDINDVPLPLPYPPSINPDVYAVLGVDERRRLLDDPDVAEGLAFLDDSVPSDLQTSQELPPAYAQMEPHEAPGATQGDDSGWQADYERWLRGLGHNPNRAPYYRRITRGLRSFIQSRVDFYTELEGKNAIDSWRVGGKLQDVTAKTPHTARFGLLDLYWLARLLRAEVSSVGVVTYTGRSWLRLLGERARTDGEDSTELDEAVPVLRAVFDFTCDLILNSVAIACDRLDRKMNPETFPEWPAETVTWRRAYDEEQLEVARQRLKRGIHRNAHFGVQDVASLMEASGQKVGWSRRVLTGEHLENVIGLAFSGGGIRSATFNLGVLQRLQELDLLRSVDYMSTVSGGGYIGGWLLGNVRRTQYWLSQLTDWVPSIEHLRRYSNYLAPRSGLMSVDTWTMWASWIRNAFLIQLTAVVWLWVLLLGTRINESIFTWHRFESLATTPSNLILAPMVFMLTIAVCRSVLSETRPIKEGDVLALAVAPAWLGSFITAAMLWADRPHISAGSSLLFSDVLAQSWRGWKWPLTVMFVSLSLLAACSIDTRRSRIIAFIYGVVTAVLAMSVVYLGFCGVRFMFGQWGDEDRYAWMAYVFGPPLVLFAMSLPIVAIIGLIGNDSEDWRREWWTRFGSWIGIWGVGFMLLSLTSVFAPLIVLYVFDRSWGAVQWGTVAGWVATIAGGLLSGNSDRTSGGEGRTMTAAALEWFSKIAAVAFVVGAVLIGATLLHVLMVKIFTDQEVLSSKYWTHLMTITTRDYWIAFVVLTALALLFSWRFEINIFGLNQFYRNRLVRCYLGATRWRLGLRTPHAFTGFDSQDDLELCHFRNLPTHEHSYRGPFPILNGSLNLGGSSDLGVHTRHSASFVFTPMRAGADRKAVGYAPMYGVRRSYAGGMKLGQAISVSGAAASPNMGYSTSPLVAFLLTMFNVRLAWWFPNPGRPNWHKSRLPISTWYLVKEMFGLADEHNHFINVSDGGHFENLGIYELVRRRCKVIIASDAECDPNLTFGSLGNVIRLCEVDFDAKIEIDVESIRRQKTDGVSRAHCAIGRINYSNGSRGYLIYMKSSLTGDEDASIEQYLAQHKAFPHESTADQFFAEDQFESYRRLGYHIAKLTFRDVEHEPTLVEMARNLFNLWSPASDVSSFVGQAEQLDDIWERFRSSPTLHPLLDALMANAPTPFPLPVPGVVPANPQRVEGEQLAACLELIQLMENVFIALQLDDFWVHPDNRGWVTLFTSWAKCGTFRQAWQQTRSTFGIGFAYFCEHRLGLPSPNGR
ncbi:MAG TPA: patatin-like phospholipase family protein [Vicinamibacterales bacterium]